MHLNPIRFGGTHVINTIFDDEKQIVEDKLLSVPGTRLVKVDPGNAYAVADCTVIDTGFDGFSATDRQVQEKLAEVEAGKFFQGKGYRFLSRTGIKPETLVEKIKELLTP